MDQDNDALLECVRKLLWETGTRLYSQFPTWGGVISLCRALIKWL